jgi:hypothetical protein
MISVLRNSIGDTMNGKEFKGYKVSKSDDFEYTDPIDKSVSSKQVLTDRFFLCLRPRESALSLKMVLVLSLDSVVLDRKGPRFVFTSRDTIERIFQ